MTKQQYRDRLALLMEKAQQRSAENKLSIDNMLLDYCEDLADGVTIQQLQDIIKQVWECK